MTNLSSPQQAHRAPVARDDPRTVFAKAVALGGAVVAGVRPEQLDAPTPCTEYDVRDLLGHLVGVLRRVAALGRGENPFSVPLVVSDVADDGWPTAWEAAAHEVQAAWSDDASLARVVRLPCGEAPGHETLAVYTSEVLTHTWDLAKATGQEPAWDDAVVGVALAAARRKLPAEDRTAALLEAIRRLPPELRNVRPPFAEAVAVPADAPLIDQLVAWNGRRP